MNEIINGEMDGEKIVRAETVFDKIEKVLVEEHDCHASPEDGCDCGNMVDVVDRSKDQVELDLATNNYNLKYVN